MAEWNENSVLSNFRNLRAGQFDPVRETFGIDLSDELLTACAVHCALVLRRDPTVGELKLWNRLAGIPAPIADASLASLETESAAIAETYADMMAKQRELTRETKPLTLSGALDLASDALERGGKERRLKGFSLRLTDRLSAPFAVAGITEENSPAFLSIRKEQTRAAQPESGDLCLLVDRGALSRYDFSEVLLESLESDEIRAGLRALLPVTETGLLPALFSRFDGLTVDLSQLGQTPIPSPEILAGAFEGAWIFVFPKRTANELAAALRSHGLSCRIFAELTSGKQLRILGGRQLIESTDFLRSLFSARTDFAAVLRADGKTDSISTVTHNGFSCRFLPVESASAGSVAAMGLSAFSASAKLSERAFSTTVLAAIVPVLSCALSGVDYSELRLATDLTLPKADFSDPAAAFASAIGLYRVQAELGIPAAQTNLSEQPVKAPVFSVFALGKGGKAPADKLTSPDSKIYLIPIPFSHEGLPDFAALRVLLDDLTAQANHGVIRSARIVLQKAPKKVLAEMQRDLLSACPVGSSKVLSKPLALGILLESIYEMPFDCVATVKELPQIDPPASKEGSEAPAPFRIPRGNGLIWRATPEIVILAPANSADALALAMHLRRSGNSVKIFEPTEKELFLRAVLTASIVYVLPGAPLPKGRKAEFAFSVMRQDGGEICRLQKDLRKKF